MPSEYLANNISLTKCPVIEVTELNSFPTVKVTMSWASEFDTCVGLIPSNIYHHRSPHWQLSLRWQCCLLGFCATVEKLT